MGLVYMGGAERIGNANGQDLDMNLGDCLLYDHISWVGLQAPSLLLFYEYYTGGAGGPRGYPPFSSFLLITNPFYH